MFLKEKDRKSAGKVGGGSEDVCWAVKRNELLAGAQSVDVSSESDAKMCVGEGEEGGGVGGEQGETVQLSITISAVVVHSSSSDEW